MYLGIVGEAEIVIRAKVEHGRRSSRHGDGRRLRRGDNTLALIRVGGLDALNGFRPDLDWSERDETWGMWGQA